MRIKAWLLPDGRTTLEFMGCLKLTLNQYSIRRLVDELGRVKFTGGTVEEK